MTRSLRAAVIGLGSMGANHARVLSDTPGVELVAVADANPAAVNKTIAGRPIPGFPDAATLLRETRPDMVSIVVPTQLHEEVALQAIAAGANVLVEKPIAATLDAARRIAVAAEQAGLVLTVSLPGHPSLGAEDGGDIASAVHRIGERDLPSTRDPTEIDRFQVHPLE